MAPRVIGHYEFGPLACEGAMGVLHRGRDLRTGRPVALKTLNEAQRGSDRCAEALRTEYAILKGLKHPNVVAAHDLLEEDDGPVLVLDWIEGQDLRAALSKGRLPLGEALEAAKGIASGLCALHQHRKSVVHGDVKPENVMLRAGEGPLRRDRVVLVDLGTALPLRQGRGILAKAAAFVQARLRGSQVVGGSSLYMSPEQASPELREIDARADVYALGAVLFEMLTGRPPFLNAQDEKRFEDHGRVSLSAQEALLQAHYGAELRNLHLTAPPPSPRRFNPAVPESVEQIVLTCLQKDPARRFASALDLLTALTSFRVEADGTVVGTRLQAGAAPQRQGFLLQAVSGPLRGTEWALDGALRAGRAVDAAHGIRLPERDKAASGEHALFQVSGDAVLVTDLESSNGTYVNNRKVAKGRLKDGDRVRLGDTVLKVVASR